MSLRGTELALLPPTADVSMVMVGALARRGPEFGVLWSAMVMPRVREAAVVGWGGVDYAARQAKDAREAMVE